MIKYVLLFLLAACGGLDNDGFTAADGDCNDSNSEIYPGAFEACDGQDNNCDGVVDEDCNTEEADADADADADGDSDADGDTDTDLPDDTGDDTGEPCEEFDWYRDADADGYGNPGASTSNCTQPDGYVADATDCDDNAANVHPGSGEWCNSVDDDCDGDVDESTSTIWYTDADRDGFGDESSAVDVICDGESGSLVAPSDVTGDGVYDFDCNDADADVYPLADEWCNEADDDCDGSVDEEAEDASRWCLDADGDGYGGGVMDTDACEDEWACEQPDGYVANATDCDDADDTVNPGAAEQCNDIDDDCDGALMDSEVDNDGDGFNECADSDCDDTSSVVYDGASETCNGVDDDCDGFTDESDADGASTWYHDGDSDGYGDDSTGLTLCDAPLGYVAIGGDCDDANASASPAGTEVCDGADNDCDGTTDVDASDDTVWSLDSDGDGEGSDSTADYLVACEQPDGYVADFSDCDDSEASVNTSATEVYDDGVDNDCDGTIDNAGIFCCADADGDGYGDENTCVSEMTGVCSDPTYVEGDSDCDDTNSSINPEAFESPFDTLDTNCNGDTST